MSIRSHLLLLALAAVLPVLAFGVFVSVALVRYERETQRIGTVDQARAMMTAIDAQLRGSLAALQALASSRSLSEDNIATFRVTAGRVLATQPTWLDISVARPDAEKVMDLHMPPGTALGKVRESGSFENALKTLQPQVGDVVTEALPGEPGVPLRVPVIRDGRPIYVVTASVRTDAFRDLIVAQQLPPRWICGLIDRQFHSVARIPAVPIGSNASPQFIEAAKRSREGWYRGLTVERVDTFTAHITSPFSGWTLGLAIPTGLVEMNAYRSAWLIGLGALLSISLALAATVFIGRRIATPIRSLAIGARSLETGAEVTLEDPESVSEVTAVAAALQDAAVAVRERERLLQTEKKILQDSDNAKDEFLAMLSHELRNPLAALSAAAYLLKTADPAHPAAVRARAVVERQTTHMTRLVEDLLDVSRITMGKASLAKAGIDLAEAVSRVVELWRNPARLSQRRLEFTSMPVWIQGDRERLEQIVSNLLDNAVKFTADGGKISVSVRREGDKAQLRVADEGEGILAELLPRVFELFVQGPRGIDRGKGGMGIGLALVRRLTEMHGGTVSAASPGRGKGTTFTIELPLEELQPGAVGH
jgi:signal transduction histidine kinase